MTSTSHDSRRPFTIWVVQFVLFLFLSFLIYGNAMIAIEQGLERFVDIEAALESPGFMVRRLILVAYILFGIASFVGMWFRASWARWLGILIFSSFFIFVAISLAAERELLQEAVTEISSSDLISVIGFLIGISIVLGPIGVGLLILIFSRKTKEYFSRESEHPAETLGPPPPPKLDG